ncbi:unnamed protein product [marine sediment metagenome]|uniref:Uncharacterized protein n=1 Tax=marine sediment metagenome TaxID=412755 RepID=X1ATH1_9ZZZZ
MEDLIEVNMNDDQRKSGTTETKFEDTENLDKETKSLGKLILEVIEKKKNTKILLPINQDTQINNTFPEKTLTAREYFNTQTKDLPKSTHSSRFKIAEMVIYKILDEITSTPTQTILDSLLIEIYSTYVSIRHIERKDSTDEL